MEVLGYEDSPGLFGTAYAALPEDLKADTEKTRPSAGPDRELTVEERERIEWQQLRYEERDRTGSSCPETEARLKEIHKKRKQQRV